MRINAAFVGAGNVAWHLAPALDNAGVIITEVYNRNKKEGAALVKRLYQAQVKDDLDFSRNPVDVIFLCVADDVIEDLAAQLIIDSNTIVAHLSGALPIISLSNYFRSSGVFYPLQTFSKTKNVDFRQVPILIEGTDKHTLTTLKMIGQALSRNVFTVTSAERSAVHLAAVFASNFANHMLTISEKLLKKEKLNLSILHPLISETIKKAITIGPTNAQTGPARRQDLKTLDKHITMLQEDEETAEIYRLVSQHILDSYS